MNARAQGGGGACAPDERVNFVRLALPSRILNICEPKSHIDNHQLHPYAQRAWCSRQFHIWLRAKAGSAPGAMGKQNKKEQIMKITTRQLGGKRDVNSCGEELQSLFACMAVSGDGTVGPSSPRPSPLPPLSHPPPPTAEIGHRV